MAEQKKIELSKQEQSVELSSPQQVLTFSNQLKQIIVDKQLYTPIKNKNYVNVEGWQIAGMCCGIYPVVNYIENLSNETEIKYQATVTLHRMTDDKLMGKGIALCSNKEYTKRKFDEYAIASMAQTRAVSKAYRSVLGYVMKMAGYETTPAEELDDDSQPATTVYADVMDADQAKINSDIEIWTNLRDEAKTLCQELLVAGCQQEVIQATINNVNGGKQLNDTTIDELTQIIEQLNVLKGGK